MSIFSEWSCTYDSKRLASTNQNHFFTNIGSIEDRELSGFVTDSERFFAFNQVTENMHIRKGCYAPQ